ncbi:coiled-coil domain-containing protein 80 isoform X3 [Phocoena sinus]|uniref:coiled-coil domain-containing protein 80 isoform X3 n=1 Tax=Phocoena sinus TaxID=42100 RepID=UPI0013C467F2|nr:coiled-coil domain-containing protein 80 isoform X3 [Phocoena sinus]
MTWRMGPSFTMLLALWLVCGSEPHAHAMNRGSRGGQKAPPVSPVNRRPARLLRHTGRSQGIERTTPEEPNLQPLQRRRSIPVLRVAHATAPSASLGIHRAPVRTVRRPAARSSPREMVRDEGSSARSRMLRFPSGSSSPNILASFAGKNRVWVISAPHASEGYYRLMMSLLKDDVYCELAERHIQQIVLFHQAGEEGGKVRRITTEGRVLEQPLDPSLIPKLMSFLKLEKGKFGMVLLKKTLQVEERYPYPVRLEAMYEIIDQGPIRRIEKIRQKGFVQKCKNLYPPPRKEQPRERPQTARRPSKATSFERFTAAPPTTVSEPSTRAGAGRFQDNRTDRWEHGPRDPNVGPGPHKPAKGKPPQKKARDKILSNEYEGKYDLSRPTASQLEEELQVGNVAPKKAKESKKHEKLEKPEKEKKKRVKSEKADKLLKSEKQVKKDKAEKKSRQEKEKNKKKKAGRTEKDGHLKPTKHFAQSPRKSVTDLLGPLEGKRRLLLITAPKAENSMYVQQRDEYLESFCKMATRKVSVITIFGPVNNSTMKIDHFQLDNEKPMRVVDDEDLVDQHLISELRKEYGMTYNDFFMVLTDVDLRVKQYYEVPIAMKSVFDVIDTFQSRIKDMEKQKKEGIVCKEDKKQSLENFLSRFRWRRRLLVISAPNDEDWAYSQQLSALSGQACNFGLRHITVLKLLGVGEEVGGVLELFPINGSSVVEREDIPAHLVKDIRNYFQVSPEYFSMLLVGKDGNVKSWYPSPMWSMVIVYDLIDSMQLRRQEMAIQQSLGMRCPEDEYAGYGYHQGYQDGYQDDYRHHESYHHGYPY